MRAAAFAKVNLGLRVGSVREDGFHPIRSLFQSISWSDRLELVAGDEDGIAGWNGEEVPDGDANLARRAVVAMREAVGSTASIYLRLQKRIPVAAGLGGGSADAAAALHLARRMLKAPVEKVAELAAGLGSDVPFCITGGTALVTGRGDVVTSLRPLLGYGMALVVPPVELATPQVYRRWDVLGEPTGPVFGATALPPILREHAPIINDLYPAAVTVAPALDDWRSELQATWGRSVLMTGSGPTLLGFFVDAEEAGAALDAVPAGARAAYAARPVSAGWAIDD